MRGGGDSVPTYSAAFTTDRREVVLEGPTVGEWCEVAEEGKLACVVECDQSGEEQTAEQLGKDAHRQEKCRPRRYPAFSIECDTAARHDHMHMGVYAVRTVMPSQRRDC